MNDTHEKISAVREWIADIEGRLDHAECIRQVQALFDCIETATYNVHNDCYNSSPKQFADMKKMMGIK